jgi:mannitol/fructose-specific phosphotransferase system IIA component (Ntr-type)
MTNSFLQNILRPELVCLRLRATNKDDAIRELLALAAAGGALPNPAEAERVVLDRERAMSTGMDNGIAIPHAKCSTVERPVVAIGLAPNGLEFEALDGQPSRVVILVVSPARNTGVHLRLMAEISRALRRPEVRERVLAAESGTALTAALIEFAGT